MCVTLSLSRSIKSQLRLSWEWGRRARPSDCRLRALNMFGRDQSQSRWPHRQSSAVTGGAGSHNIRDIGHSCDWPGGEDDRDVNQQKWSWPINVHHLIHTVTQRTKTRSSVMTTWWLHKMKLWSLVNLVLLFCTFFTEKVHLNVQLLLNV